MRVYIYLFVSRWRLTALYPDDFYSVSPCTIWRRIGIPCRERAYHLAEWYSLNWIVEMCRYSPYARHANSPLILVSSLKYPC